MSAETLQASLLLNFKDSYGTSYGPAQVVQQYASQTKFSFREYTIPANTKQIMWDPTTWTGEPVTAFQGAYFWIQDAAQVTAGVNLQPLYLEVICHLSGAQGWLQKIPPGGFWCLPSNVAYYTPNAQNDMTTGSTAGVINKLRAWNQDTSAAVKLAMLLIDNT